MFVRCGASFTYYVQNGGAILLRCRGEDPCARLPDRLGGVPLVGIAGYAFSEKPPVPPAGVQLLQEGDAGGAPELAGNFVQRLSLPDGVRCIGPSAFYNCRHLEALELPGSLARIDGDAFMNCRALDTLVLRADPAGPGPLRQAGMLLSRTFRADFVQGGRVTARLLFSEYYEELEENAPAHLFSREVVGVGYRLRQCFAGETLRFAEYDRIACAAADEPPARMAQLALERLRFPYELSETAAQNYRAWLAAHAADALCYAAGLDSEELLAFALELGFAGRAAISEAAALARTLQKPRAAALLLQASRPAAASPCYDF